MKRAGIAAVLGAAAALIGVLTYFNRDDALRTEIDIAPYGKVDVIRFAGHARNLIIYFSDSKGWRKELQDEAWREAWPDRIVAGINLPQFRSAFAGKSCADYAGAVQTISAAVARTLRIMPDEQPFLIGMEDGATVAYAAAAQSPPDKVQAAVSRDFCPALRDLPPPCGLEVSPQGALQPSETFKTPFVAVTDPAACKSVDVRDFMAKLPDAHIVPAQPNIADLMVSVVTQTNARTSVDPTVSTAALEGLPLIELPSTKSGDDRLAIVLTGDGGWADIDRSIGEDLAKQGVAVVGFNSLKYFWEAQTPGDAAADLQRVMRHYMKAWHRSRVILVGFSFGADVLPFLYPRLPSDIRQNITLMALLAPSAHASYEISVGGWVGVEDKSGPELAPAVAALNLPTLCVQSLQEDERPCDGLANANLEVMPMKGDHHFDGNYVPIVARILAKTKK